MTNGVRSANMLTDEDIDDLIDGMPVMQGTWRPGDLDLLITTVGLIVDRHKSGVRVDEVVALLDAIDGTDPEVAHSRADQIIASTTPPEVQQALVRLISRCRWWATA